jgi:hypothetical protein
MAAIRRPEVAAGRRRLGQITPGASPGTLTDQVPGVRRVVLKSYSRDGVETREDPDAAACEAFRARGERIWLDIAGVPDSALLGMLGEAFGLHRLALEDVQRAGTSARCRPVEDVSSSSQASSASRPASPRSSRSASLGRPSSSASTTRTARTRSELARHGLT